MLANLQHPSEPHSRILGAGDMAVSHGMSTLVEVDVMDKVERALAWRKGMLEFAGTRLSDVMLSSTATMNNKS